MNQFVLKKYYTIIALFTFTIAMGQSDSTKLDGGIIEVEIDYIPQVIKAVKIQATPQIDSSEIAQKTKPKYNYLETEVASDFKASELKAVTQKKKRPEIFYPNYIKAGYGFPSTILAEGFYTHALNNDSNLGTHIYYYNNNPKLKDVVQPQKNNRLKATVFYNRKKENNDIKADINFEREGFYYYSLADENIELPKSTYTTISSNLGLISQNSEWFKKLDTNIHLFNNNENSNEIYANLKGDLFYDIQNFTIKGSPYIQFLNGKQNTSSPQQNYSFMTVGLQPSFTIGNSNNYIDLGVDLAYNSDFEGDNSDFHLFPKVQGQYVINSEMLIFANALGGIKHNTLKDLTYQNQFLGFFTPMKPTILNFDIEAGIKGNLSSALGYSFSGGYSSAKDEAFFVSSDNNEQLQSYTYNNSFEIIYDNLNTIKLGADLTYLMTKNLDVALKGRLNFYTTDQKEAWNKPTFTTTLNANYKIFDEKLTLGTDLYFVGTRQDFVQGTTEKVNAYIDFNLKAAYAINNRFTVFLNGTNLRGSYNQFYNYKTQGAGVLGGVKFKF